MSPLARPFLVMGLVAALTGCGSSTPLRYHALSGTPTAPVAQGHVAALVEVLPITIPERINRDEVVMTGPDGRLDVRSGERWAAPLGDEFRQLVDDALWTRVRAADVFAAPVPASTSGLPQYRLALKLERLEARPGALAVAEASWTVRRLPQGQPAICRAGFTEPLGSTDTDAAVVALSRASTRLAGAVAASLERLHLNSGDPCGE